MDGLHQLGPWRRRLADDGPDGFAAGGSPHDHRGEQARSRGRHPRNRFRRLAIALDRPRRRGMNAGDQVRPTAELPRISGRLARSRAARPQESRGRGPFMIISLDQVACRFHEQGVRSFVIGGWAAIIHRVARSRAEFCLDHSARGPRFPGGNHRRGALRGTPSLHRGSHGLRNHLPGCHPGKAHPPQTSRRPPQGSGSDRRVAGPPGGTPPA